jgi:cysteine-rich repeat protein
MDPELSFTCDPANCHIRSQFCGNGEVNPGEQCDNGNRNISGPSTAPQVDCRIDCSRPRCGDRLLDAYERCDDGNRMIGDGCNQFCQPEGSGSGFGPIVIDLPFVGNIPLVNPDGSVTETGPGVVAVMAAGAAAGWAWMRRRNRRP